LPHDLLVYDDTPLPAVDRQKVLSVMRAYVRRLQEEHPENGAGKSTCSGLLFNLAGSVAELVNPDEIARKLLPEAPEKVALQAGRLTRRRMDEFDNSTSLKMVLVANGGEVSFKSRRLPAWVSRSLGVIIGSGPKKA
jgi:hypothetical protein